MNHINPHASRNELRTLFNGHRLDGNKLLYLLEDMGISLNPAQKSAVHEHIHEQHDARCAEFHYLMAGLCGTRPEDLAKWWKHYLLDKTRDDERNPNAWINQDTSRMNAAELAEFNNGDDDSFFEWLQDLKDDPTIDFDKENRETNNYPRAVVLRATNPDTKGYFVFHCNTPTVKALRFELSARTIHRRAQKEMIADGYRMSVEEPEPMFYYKGACYSWDQAKRSLKETTPAELKNAKQGAEYAAPYEGYDPVLDV